MSNGEAVLCYQNNNAFIMAKVRTVVGSVAPEAIESSLRKRLSAEADIISDNCKVLQFNKELWNLHIYDIDCDMTKYVLLAYALIDEYFCVIEANFLTFEDYAAFVNEFEVFSRSIDFKQLRRSVGEITVEDCVIDVAGISDVKLQNAGDNDALLFIGKEKYFSVTVTRDGQREKLLAAMSEQGFETLSVEVDNESVSERFRLKEEDKLSGTVELYSVPVNDYHIEILGYWLSGSDERISDNLSMMVH